MTDDEVLFNRQTIKKIIEEYKKSPCLWNREDERYLNRSAKNDAWLRITRAAQEFDPKMTTLDIKKRMESLRACHRKEKRRVFQSPNYEPKLWYYNLLSFIRNSKYETGDNVQKQDEDPSNVEEVQIEDNGSETYLEFELDNERGSTDCLMQPTFVESSSPGRNYRKPSVMRQQDEYDAVGINVAAKLRKLPYNMRVIAEKLIGDVIYNAQLNTLTTKTTLHTPDPFKTDC